MNHTRIREEDIIERYVLGKLVPEEEAEFEAHYFSCDRCFQEIQVMEKIVQAVRQGAENEELTFDKLRAGKRFSIFDLYRMPAFSPAFAIVSLIIVLILIYPAWRGIFKLADLENSIEEMRKPQANAQSLFLSQVRSGGAAAIPSIKLGKEKGFFVLSFNILEKKVLKAVYRCEILDASGGIIWTAENLEPFGAYEVFSIACQGEFFEPGEYILMVSEIDSENGVITNQVSLDFGVIK